MTNRKNILQQLVKLCFFAANNTRLASLLGQKGRMNITRLIDGTLGDRAVNHLWEEIGRLFGVPEEILPHLPAVWDLCNQLKNTPNVLRLDAPPEEHTQPQSIENDTWQQIQMLWGQDRMLYYILLGLLYAKCNHINPYQQKGMRATAQVINELNTYLHQLYPQQVSANDAAQQLVQTIEKEDVDSWWWIGYFGSIVLRLYYEPTYVEDIFQKGTTPMPFMWWQWWRDASSNKAGDTLWFCLKNGTTDAIYDIMRIEDQQNVMQAEHFMLLFNQHQSVRLLHTKVRKTTGINLWWQLEEINGKHVLTFTPEEEHALNRLLPKQLVTLHEQDDPHLVNRARQMSDEMKRETELRRYSEEGLVPTTEYQIVDIECSRRTLRVLYRYHDEAVQTAKFALVDYPALRAVMVHSQVELLVSTSDGRLFALWNEVGVLLALNE